MAIDFSFPEEVTFIVARVRQFCDEVVQPAQAEIEAHEGDRKVLVRQIVGMRKAAKEWGLWLPHMPGNTEAWASTTRRDGRRLCRGAARKSSFGPFALNAQAPDRRATTLLHWATPAQKEKYLRPLCESTTRSCFAMTEPEVAGSDPTLIETRAVRDGDDWVVNGHKWFISGARGAKFAILIARTEEDPEIPQAGNSAFLVDLPSEGWEIVRDVRDHERRPQPLRDPDRESASLERPAPRRSRPGTSARTGAARSRARLAHCMRWIGQAETALEMVERSLHRFAHGSLLAEKQGIQWMIADSTMELYQSKLMVLHAAYKIDRGLDFKSEVSMAKHFVAGALNRIIDRAIQVHGALGYSTPDTPLAKMATQARFGRRFADGADEVHQWRIAERTIQSWVRAKSLKPATGDLPV